MHWSKYRAKSALQFTHAAYFHAKFIPGVIWIELHMRWILSSTSLHASGGNILSIKFSSESPILGHTLACINSLFDLLWLGTSATVLRCAVTYLRFWVVKKNPVIKDSIIVFRPPFKQWCFGTSCGINISRITCSLCDIYYIVVFCYL